MATFESLGVRRVINASGNNSALGSSHMSQTVLDAMHEASKCYVDMNDLHTRAGELIARITGAEAGFVTTGATGGLYLATAACITHCDQAKMLGLPESANGAEVVLQKGHRTGYDQALRTVGAKIIEVGLPYLSSVQDIEYALNEDTVALLYTFGELIDQRGKVSLDVMIELGKKHNIPVIVDGAAVNYPLSRLRELVSMGPDLIATSGGKHIFGPPGTGFLCGRKELIEACRLQAGPAYGIGRPLKLGKEEIIGLLTALEVYEHMDFEAQRLNWESKARFITDEIGGLSNIQTRLTEFDEVNRPVPRAIVWIDEANVKVSAYEVARMLKEGNPPVRVQEFLLHEDKLIFNPVCLLDGDEKLLVTTWKKLWQSLGLE